MRESWRAGVEPRRGDRPRPPPRSKKQGPPPKGIPPPFPSSPPCNEAAPVQEGRMDDVPLPSTRASFPCRSSRPDERPRLKSRQSVSNRLGKLSTTTRVRRDLCRRAEARPPRLTQSGSSPFPPFSDRLLLLLLLHHVTVIPDPASEWGPVSSSPPDPTTSCPPSCASRSRPSGRATEGGD